MVAVTIVAVEEDNLIVPWSPPVQKRQSITELHQTSIEVTIHHGLCNIVS